MIIQKLGQVRSSGGQQQRPIIKHANNCASFLTLKGHLCKMMMIPHLGFGCIITLDSGVPPKVQQYMITIGSFLECSYQYFKDMATKSLGKRGQWANCKHLYFVFIVIGSLDSNRDAFICAPSFSFNEVKRILESSILASVFHRLTKCDKISCNTAFDKIGLAISNYVFNRDV
jgi:hypothetical protein